MCGFRTGLSLKLTVCLPKTVLNRHIIVVNTSLLRVPYTRNSTECSTK